MPRTKTKFPDELLTEKFDQMTKGFEDIHNVVHARYNDTDKKLGAIDTKIDSIDMKVTYTNGKVRKIIIALVLLTGIAIGLGFEYARIVIPFVLAI